VPGATLIPQPPAAQLVEALRDIPSPSVQLQRALRDMPSHAAQLSEALRDMPSPSAQLAAALSDMPTQADMLQQALRNMPSPSAQLAEAMRHMSSPTPRLTDVLRDMPSPAAQLSELLRDMPSPAAQLSELLRDMPSPAAQLSELLKDQALARTVQGSLMIPTARYRDLSREVAADLPASGAESLGRFSSAVDLRPRILLAWVRSLPPAVQRKLSLPAMVALVAVIECFDLEAGIEPSPQAKAVIAALLAIAVFLDSR
jgi:hypothetical protein